MARTRGAGWWKQTVYPPRYFCGFLKLANHRGAARQVDFIDAPMIPLDRQTCALFMGERGRCFYSSKLTGHRFNVLEIQYAISVMDTGRDMVRVEKFNHVFKHPGKVVLETRGGMTTIRMTAGNLYDTYTLGEVFDNFGGVSRPVLQFIA